MVHVPQLHIFCYNIIFIIMLSIFLRLAFKVLSDEGAEEKNVGASYNPHSPFGDSKQIQSGLRGFARPFHCFFFLRFLLSMSVPLSLSHPLIFSLFPLLVHVFPSPILFALTLRRSI